MVYILNLTNKGAINISAEYVSVRDMFINMRQCCGQRKNDQLGRRNFQETCQVAI